jgi:hypothetical protein
VVQRTGRRAAILFLALTTTVITTGCVERGPLVCVGWRHSRAAVADVAQQYDLGDPVCDHGQDYVPIRNGDTEAFEPVRAELLSDGWKAAPHPINKDLEVLTRSDHEGVTVEFYRDTRTAYVRYR